MSSILRRIRTITSHAGYARFNAELSADPVDEIPRQVPTPYAFSATHVVWDWHGRHVIICETRHRRYEVFEVTHD